LTSLDLTIFWIKHFELVIYKHNLASSAVVQINCLMVGRIIHCFVKVLTYKP